MKNRFWSKVRRSPGCWEWTAAKSSDGYGSIWCSSSRKVVSAHRWAYEELVGPIGDSHVLHSCDNPSCVNPEHLFLGTHADNMRDRHNKGRAASMAGEASPRAILSAASVLAIRREWAAGASYVALAVEHGVSESAIGHVCQRRSWKHI